MDRKIINCSKLIKRILIFPVKAPYKVFGYLKNYIDSYLQESPGFGKKLDRKFLADLRVNHEEELDGYFTDKKIAGPYGEILDIDDIKAAIKTLSVIQKAEITEAADNICGHIFNLLGSGSVNISLDFKAAGFEEILYEMPLTDEVKIQARKKLKAITRAGYEPIDWHIDFRSGFRWDAGTWHRKITFGNNPGSDIKIPWELSRCYHFITLGQAYQVNSNEKYAEEFVSQTCDWITNNPPYKGANWICAMEAAIRLCNWLLAFAMFKDSAVINRDFIRLFIKSVYIHTNFIKSNLEKHPFMVKTNHYISDIAGLAYAGVFLRAFIFGKKLIDFSVRELKKEMASQVYSDGCSFEASTCYHKLVLEMFFYSTIMIARLWETNKNNKKTSILNSAEKIFGKDYISRLKKMFEFIKSASKPNGELPQIGDNDSGRLHVFDCSSSRDIKFLLNAGAVFFEESSFKINEFEPFSNCAWIFGETGTMLIEKLKGISFADIESCLYKDAGWVVSRSNSSQVFISAGSNGQGGDGGHSHNDKLSFDYVYNGEDIITDIGTFTYTALPVLRDKFRSTLAHNTVNIDGLEQNPIKQDRLFFLEDHSKARINCLVISRDLDFIDAAHYGYSFLETKSRVVHKRQFLVLKQEASIFLKDTISGKGKHNVVAVFHIGPYIDSEINDENEVSFFNKQRENILKLCFFSKVKPAISVKSFPLSQGYGLKSDSKMLEYCFNINMPSEHYFAIYRPEIKYTFGEITDLFMKVGQ